MQHLRDRAASVSRDPAHEVVILPAYGPVADDENEVWLSDMDKLAEQIGSKRTIWTSNRLRCATILKPGAGRCYRAFARRLNSHHCDLRNYLGSGSLLVK